MRSQYILAKLVNEHLAEVTNHPEGCAALKVLSRLRSIEEVSLGEGLPGSVLGRLEESLPRDMGPVAHVPS